MVHRIEDGEVIRAELQRPVDQAVGVHAGIAAVAGYLVVEIRFRVGPIPLGDHEVPLHALRPRRCRRRFTGGDPVGPVREHRQGALAAELLKGAAHLAAGLSGLDPPVPRGGRGREATERRRNLPGSPAPQLVTREAGARLQDAEKLRLGSECGRDAVSRGSGARELARLRHVEQGEPVAGGVVLRGGLRVRRWDRGEVLPPARGGRLLGRVHQPVPPDPDAVVRLREVGQQVAAPLIGDDDPGEPGGEVAGFRDHPDSGLRSRGAGDHAADIVSVHLDRLAVERAGTASRREGGREGAQAGRDRGGEPDRFRSHVLLSIPRYASCLTLWHGEKCLSLIDRYSLFPL